MLYKSYRPNPIRWFSIVILTILGIVTIGYRSADQKTTDGPIHSSLRDFSGRLNEEAVRALWDNRAQLLSQAPEVVPLQTSLERSSAGGRLLFAHFADGLIPGTDRYMLTTFNLVNSTVYPAAGTLSFYGNDGKPLQVTIGGQTKASFAVSLAANRSLTLATAGTGSIKSGWALLTSDQPLIGTSSFTTRNKSGTIYTDVGVEESLLGTEFTLFADTIGAADTGLALVNPDPARTVHLTLDLYDAAGALKKSTTLNLGPRAHDARFVSEVYKGTAGIADFRGSVRVRGDLPFAGITLRTLGSLLTSVPMVAPPDPRSERTTLSFPQVADGTDGGFRIVTSVILFNNTGGPVSGKVDFLTPSGGPLQVRVGSQQGSSFPFNLAPNGTYYLQTQGTGAGIRTGWAQVTMDRPIDGTAIYHILNTSGAAITEVGVSPADYSSQQSAIAESTGSYRTGLALANPNKDNETEVTLRLLDAAGTVKSTYEETLGPLSQKALFVDEIFKGVTGIDEFQGRVALSSSDEYAAMTLRQAGLLTTSVPILRHLGGFSPVSELELQQELAGSSPALRWRYQQPALDLALEQIRISAPGLGLKPNSIKPGDDIGYGIFLISYGSSSQGGIMKLIASGDASTPGAFDAVISMQDLGSGIGLFSGRITGQSQSGFVFELGPNGAPNADSSITGLDLDIYLKDGIVQAPGQAGNQQVTTTATSTSAKFDEAGAGIVQTTTQTLAFQAAAAGSPAFTQVRPLFFSPGTWLNFTGTNLASDMTVNFAAGQATVPADFVEATATTAKMGAPSGAVSGEIRARRGSTTGPPFRMLSVFSPKAALTRAGTSTVTFSFVLSQAARELGLQEFDLRILNAGWPTAKTDAEGTLGSLTFRGGSTPSGRDEYEIRLLSSSADSMTLSVKEGADYDDFATILVSKLGTSGASLRFQLSDVPDLPSVNGHPLTVTLTLTGLQFKPAAGSTLFWSADALSLASQLFGPETGILAKMDTVAIN